MLKELPVATVFEKLNFPLKFEKDAFLLDFSSGSGISSSDPDIITKRSVNNRESSLSTQATC